MEINELLQGIDCACGRHHRCDIRYVAIGSNAIAQLGDMVKGYGRILLVADENTYAVAGEKTEKALTGKILDKVIFSGKTVRIFASMFPIQPDCRITLWQQHHLWTAMLPPVLR